MEDLLSRALYHPLLALPTFYLTDLMFNVDCSVVCALLVLASVSVFRLARLLTGWFRVRRGEPAH
jgi:hypothetical protein